MDIKEIKELLSKRFEIIDIIHKCRNSINEISLTTFDTISLIDLKDNIDFEKYPELDYLFSEENLSYLRPYHGELMGLNDKDLGIACRELVVAEIACLLGVDLTGRHNGGVTGLCTKYKIDIAKMRLDIANVSTKPITYFRDVLDIRFLWGNNERLFEEINNIKRNDQVIFDERDNTLLIITESEQTDGTFKKWSYCDDVYDLLYPYQRDLGDKVVISDEILDEEFYNKIKVLTTLSLEEAIKKTLDFGFGTFEGNVFYIDKNQKKFSFIYDGNKENLDDFASLLADKMNNLLNNINIVDFLEAFACKIEEICMGYNIPELEDFMEKINIMKYDNDYY